MGPTPEVAHLKVWVRAWEITILTSSMLMLPLLPWKLTFTVTKLVMVSLCLTSSCTLLMYAPWYRQKPMQRDTSPFLRTNSGSNLWQFNQSQQEVALPKFEIIKTIWEMDEHVYSDKLCLHYLTVSSWWYWKVSWSARKKCHLYHLWLILWKCLLIRYQYGRLC